jgi:hypothetical protein
MNVAVRVDVELVDPRALGTECPLAVGPASIAFDVDDLAVDGVHERRAPDGAVRVPPSVYTLFPNTFLLQVLA